ncbi:WD repeat-containing protein 46 [Smittium mucronatum]|uniref:WD repeat-containing protein 46 n=1 Tax=Smittium mucronatum TaxID=133383 RepID=A0A1R0GU23_9FUNG|nr:WD repeat-containing protein 46 [Smittium mucronatum]
MSNDNGGSAAPDFPMFSKSSETQTTRTEILNFDNVKQVEIRDDKPMKQRRNSKKGKKSKALYSTEAGPRQMNEYERRLANKMEKYSRVQETNNSLDIKNKKNRAAYKKTEELAVMAARKAARAEILNTEEAGYLLFGGRKGHIASIDWKGAKIVTEFNVKETIRDVTLVLAERIVVCGGAEKVHVYIRQIRGRGALFKENGRNSGTELFAIPLFAGLNWKPRGAEVPGHIDGVRNCAIKDETGAMFSPYNERIQCGSAFGARRGHSDIMVTEHDAATRQDIGA